MDRFTKITVVTLCAVFIPAVASAQASIVGVVRDASGAVLPGVTVEAASPALIEKVRTVVTDGTGQYRVVDLRPGIYTVTFTLAGFSTVKREGVELGGNFTATVNAELRVGTVEETITVTGESPVVDIQNVRQQQVIDQEIITAIPSGRAFQHITALIPAVTQTSNSGGLQDVGGSRGPAATSDRFMVHGGLITDSRAMVDGLGVGSAVTGGASGTFYMPHVGSSREVVISTSSGMGEAETGGIVVNVVPREGGNTFHGMIFATGASESMQSDNYSQELEQRGLRAPNKIEKVWDISPAFGGPVLQDRLWYFVTGRYNGANNYVAGMYPNLNAGDPNAWTYAPDLTSQVVAESYSWSLAPRITWQVTPRNKLNGFWDEQPRCANCPGGSATTTPEAQGRAVGRPNRVQQVLWMSPVNNQLLLEAGFGTYIVRWSWETKPPQTPHLTPVTEQAGIIPGLAYRGLQLGNNANNTYNSRASASYVTGAHSLKVGYQGMFYDITFGTYSRNGGISYRFNNGVPNQLTQMLDSYARSYLNAVGLYVQDQWTAGRLTVQSALRYDRFTSRFPDQQLGPSTDRLRKHEYTVGIPNPNLPPAPMVFPAHDAVSFHDISPRIGAAYDVFGTGKTAVKVSLARYTLGQESSSTGTFGSFLNPIARTAVTTNRAWSDANRNYVPECDLFNLAANGECGAAANQNFAKNVFSIGFDPEVTAGWGVRPDQWEFSASVQQELLPRVALNVAYFRRLYGNFAVTDNLATTAADYSFFDLPVPADPRLPNGGTVLSGFVDVVPARFGQVNEIVTAAKNYGTQIHRWNGVDIDLNVRPQNGLFFQGGVSSGRTLMDNCEVAQQLPETLGSQPLAYCRRESPYLTQVKGLAGYTIPRVDVQVTATLQNVPGQEILAEYNAPNAVVAPLLRRNLSGSAANKTLALVSPMSLYGGRLNQIDVRMAKILRFGGTRTQVTVDVFNALNSNAILQQNNTFGARWQTPTSIHSARLVKLSAQLDF